MVPRFLTVLVAAVLLGGCSTPSIHSIYSKDKAVAEPGLVGSWQYTDPSDSPTFNLSQAGDAYRLHVKSRDPAEKEGWDFDVQLVKLGDERWFNAAPTEADRKAQGERWGPIFVPTNMFARYKLDGDTLTVWFLDRRAFNEALSDKKLTLAHTSFDKDTLLITAETPELQKFLAEHGTDAALFEEEHLKRIKP